MKTARLARLSGAAILCILSASACTEKPAPSAGYPHAYPTQYGPPQYGPTQYGQPQYGPTQYGQPQYGQPQYGQPQYGQPQYGQPQYGQPQYGQPQYGQPQYGQPQYGQPQYRPAPWAPPASAPAPPPPTPAPTDDGRRYAFDRINALRAENGRPPLTYDACLDTFAKAGSDELARDHRPHAHFMQSDFPCGCHVTEENQGDPNGWMPGPVTQQIDQILASMMSEGPGGGHYENLLSLKVHRVGVGLLMVGQSLYFTNDFCS